MAKKVLFVITKSNWGGAQAYVYVLATAAKAAGMEVAVALGGTGAPGADVGRLANKLAESGIRTLHLSAFTRDIYPGRDIAALSELVSLLGKERPDVLHLSSSKAGGIGSLAGRLAGVPTIVFTAHGWAHREPRALPVRILIWLASWFTVLLSHRVITVSEFDHRDAPAAFNRSKLVLIRNGIGEFPLLSREEARKKLLPAVPDSSTWILINAELTANKGIEVGIKAFEGIAAEFQSTRLVIMSDGELRAHLEDLASRSPFADRIHFLGFVADGRTYLRAADILLLTSFKEGLPTVLLEAGIAGLPVVASRTGGVPEIVRNEETGLLVTPGDVKGFSSALRVLLSGEGKDFGARLNVHVKESFSEERMIRETFALY